MNETFALPVGSSPPVPRAKETAAVVDPDERSSIEVIEEVYRACYRRLVVSAYALTNNFAEAQDVVSEAFVVAVSHPRRVARADDPEAWLRTVALNAARTRFRRRHRLDVLLRRKPPEPDSIPGLSPDRLALIEAVSSLPRRQREVIALHHLADISVGEVAQLLNVPVGSVKSWLSRGRARLAELLEDERTM